jgi:hypothetical protein
VEQGITERLPERFAITASGSGSRVAVVCGVGGSQSAPVATAAVRVGRGAGAACEGRPRDLVCGYCQLRHDEMLGPESVGLAASEERNHASVVNEISVSPERLDRVAF